MRKSQLLGVLILFIAIAVFGTTNFYWVSTEIGTPTSLFGDSSGGGDDPLNPNVNPPFPPTPPASETTPPASETTPEATPGDQPGIDGSSGNWVLFSINGNLKFSGNAVSKGRTGTNATNLINGVKPVSFSSNAKINPFKNNFYIGANATKENVVEFIGTWKPSFNDINLLDKKVYFSLPQDNSAKVKSDFNSAVAEAAKGDRVFIDRGDFANLFNSDGDLHPQSIQRPLQKPESVLKSKNITVYKNRYYFDEKLGGYHETVNRKFHGYSF